MRKILLFIAGSFLFSFFSPCVRAQLAPTAGASVDRDSILIGESVRLIFNARSDRSESIGWPEADSIPHFELIEKGKVDSVTTADMHTYQLVWKLTSFDSGNHFIPAFNFSVGGRTYRTDSILISVGYAKLDSTLDYHDIKDIVDIENPSVKYIPWLLLALTLASVFLFFYFGKGRIIETAGTEEAVYHLPPYEEALKEMEELRRLDLTDPAQVKLFYTRMNDILRRFVMRKFQVSSMERTNEELILVLSGEDLTRDQFTRLAAALRMSDFVKFAKYIPGSVENEQNFETIHASVRLLNEIVK
jgi:BatD DUF11 like domain